MRRLTTLAALMVLALGCTAQDADMADSSGLCAETAADLAPAEVGSLAALTSGQWQSTLLWADAADPVRITLELSVAAADGAMIERALVSDAGWAAPGDCASTIEADASAHLWTNDGLLDARFEGELVVDDSGLARFSGPELGGVRYLAVTFDGDEMSGLLLPPEDQFSDEADPDGVSAPAASWPAP